MNKKTKIIIASIVLLVILAAIIAFVAIFHTSNDNAESESTFEVWREKPFVYEGETESESKYSSAEAAFEVAVSALSDDIEADSQDGNEQKILCTYTSYEGTPTEIVAYTASTGNVSFLVCKYLDGKLYKSYIDTDIAELNAENDLIIVTSSDIVALRSGIGAESGQQIIYDFVSDDYDAVSYSSYENADVKEMDAALLEYNSSAAEYISFNEVSVKGN